jgi:hypothetical protein
MVEIPRPEQTIADRIYTAIEKEENSELYLSRLGASGIGDPCVRAAFYSWRAFTSRPIEGRVRKVFRTGNLREAEIIKDLRRAGFAVWDQTEEGTQFTYTDETGHLVAKVDGIIKGVPGAETSPHVMEIKTHNFKSFEELTKNGVAKSKPMHYVQLQVGMWLSGIDRGLYIALNKDNEQYYFERIHPDEKCIAWVKDRVESLVGATLTPAGISENATGWACRFCDHKEVCVGNTENMLQHCRTCRNAEPGPEGIWYCRLTSTERTIAEQAVGCEHYDGWSS